MKLGLGNKICKGDETLGKSLRFFSIINIDLAGESEELCTREQLSLWMLINDDGECKQRIIANY